MHSAVARCNSAKPWICNLHRSIFWSESALAFLLGNPGWQFSARRKLGGEWHDRKSRTHPKTGAANPWQKTHLGQQTIKHGLSQPAAVQSNKSNIELKLNSH
jgi:hypothetical protein